MISLSSAVLVVIFFTILYYLLKEENVQGKLPPGPKGLPIFGSVFSLTSKPYQRLSEWAKVYGSIFTVKVGPIRFVVISDPKLGKEAYNNNVLSGRPDFPLFNLQADGNHGILNAEGPVWVEQRRFTLKTLRDFGFGKSSMQELVQEEVKEYVQWLKSQEGNPISLNRKFTLATVNSLWSLMTSKRFPQNNPELSNFIDNNTKVFHELSGNPFVLFYPKIAKRIPTLSGWSKLVEMVKKSDQFTNIPIEEHKNRYKPEDTPEDLIEAYFHEINKTTDPKSSFHKSHGEKNLSVTVSDLFGAGSETTSVTLSWAILYLTKFKDIQTKLRAEIDYVVGNARQPVLDDRKSMPYTEAFILETLRKSSITPFGIFHAAMETTTLDGYTIPKGSWVTINHYHVHHDPQIWGDPEKLRPERFLRDNGKSVVKNDALIPFSTGKRICIGEQIAKDTIFMFLTAIIQRFEIELDPNFPEPSLESPTPMFLTPEPFYVIIKDRLQCC